MKRAILVTVVVALISTSLSAAPTAIGFSSHQGYGWSASYAVGGGVYQMSFDNIVVDLSIPLIPDLVGDKVSIPSMMISNVSLYQGIYYGYIEPQASTDLQIDHPGMHWQVGFGSFFAGGQVFGASGFSQGYLIDLTFGGTGPELYQFLSGQVGGPVYGNLNGVIMVIPAPAALLLAGIGASMVAALRRRIK